MNVNKLTFGCARLPVGAQNQIKCVARRIDLLLKFDLASGYNCYYTGYNYETSTHINTRTLHNPLSLPANLRVA